MFFQHRIFAKARNDVRIKSKRSLLDGDDPDEIAEAEALLRMLARLSDSKAQKHLDELLDEGLKGTFPASDPVSVGRFTGTEFR